MTSRQARNLSDDIRKELTDDSYFTDNIYLSIKNVGTKSFKNCKCDRLDGWLFIWTKDDTFLVRESEAGDFLIIDTNPSPPLI